MKQTSDPQLLSIHLYFETSYIVQTTTENVSIAGICKYCNNSIHLYFEQFMENR
jgi:hypothetical protein